jgi:hypothetical protein
MSYIYIYIYKKGVILHWCLFSLFTRRVHDVHGDIIRSDFWRDGDFRYKMLNLITSVVISRILHPSRLSLTLGIKVSFIKEAISVLLPTPSMVF